LPIQVNVLSIAAQLMQFQAGKVHIFRAHSHIEPAKNQAQPRGVLSLNSRLGAIGEKPLDSLVPESWIATPSSVT
jgi:hypothetical protein